ncbi:MAG: nicotinate (nicotinamide) nucleotide adenylyltransferase [Candidatus Omnitrophica bacterium]|nr:nicotinate (nicotinamide) nucleotide adenylyltransferase [Candidatus Omnitrophota bacterium]
MKIALFGGTFDPVHRGHLDLARCAKKQFELDKIIFMPASIAPNKAGQAPAASPDERCEMIRSAIEGLAGFELSTLEIDRGGISYTVDTLRLLKQNYPQDDFFLILGEDSYENFSKWHCPEEILKMAGLIVAPRYNSSTIRSRSADSSIQWIEMDEVPVASSYIKQCIRDNEPLKDLIPESVIKIIRERKLYQSV